MVASGSRLSGAAPDIASRCRPQVDDVAKVDVFLTRRRDDLESIVKIHIYCHPDHGPILLLDPNSLTDGERLISITTPRLFGISPEVRHALQDASEYLIGARWPSGVGHRGSSLDRRRRQIETYTDHNSRRVTVDELSQDTGQLSIPGRVTPVVDPDDHVVGPLHHRRDLEVSQRIAHGQRYDTHCLSRAEDPRVEQETDQELALAIIEPLAIPAASTLGLMPGHEHPRYAWI